MPNRKHEGVPSEALQPALQHEIEQLFFKPVPISFAAETVPLPSDVEPPSYVGAVLQRLRQNTPELVANMAPLPEQFARTMLPAEQRGRVSALAQSVVIARQPSLVAISGLHAVNKVVHDINIRRIRTFAIDAIGAFASIPWQDGVIAYEHKRREVARTAFHIGHLPLSRAAAKAFISQRLQESEDVKVKLKWAHNKLADLQYKLHIPDLVRLPDSYQQQVAHIITDMSLDGCATVLNVDPDYFVRTQFKDHYEPSRSIFLAPVGLLKTALANAPAKKDAKKRLVAKYLQDGSEFITNPTIVTPPKKAMVAPEIAQRLDSEAQTILTAEVARLHEADEGPLATAAMHDAVQARRQKKRQEMVTVHQQRLRTLRKDASIPAGVSEEGGELLQGMVAFERLDSLFKKSLLLVAHTMYEDLLEAVPDSPPPSDATWSNISFGKKLWKKPCRYIENPRLVPVDVDEEYARQYVPNWDPLYVPQSYIRGFLMMADVRLTGKEALPAIVRASVYLRLVTNQTGQPIIGLYTSLKERVSGKRALEVVRSEAALRAYQLEQRRIRRPYSGGAGSLGKRT